VELLPEIAGMPLNGKTRNVSLTPEIEAFINDSVASGRFRSASEVVRAALRLLEDEEHRREAPSNGDRGRSQSTHAHATAKS
jgi:antitoxin ParD1/3/4